MAARGLVARGVPKTLPRWILFVKIAILVLALVVLALSAFAISVFGSGYTYGYVYVGSGAPGLLIFVAIKTFLLYGILTAVEVWAPNYFFRLAALLGYILGIIFWLSAWAWAASVAGFWLSLADTYSSRIYGDLASKLRQEGGAMAGAAAMGAIAWVLSIINIVFFIKACTSDPESANANNQQAELGQVHHNKAQEANPDPSQPYQGNYQPPSPYQQQPAYGQPAPYGQPVHTGHPEQQQPAQYGQPAPYAAQPPQPQPYATQ